VQLCRTAGVEPVILGKQEKCCGEPMRKIGNEYLFQTMAKDNIDKINGSGAHTVVTACPHCFNTLDKDYRDFGLKPRVRSHVDFLHELVATDRLKISQQSFTCTYHDSCYLGRHNDVYDEPRELIAAAGGRLLEMEQNRARSFCCGAGGGRILADETIGERINLRRVEMAIDTAAPLLLSNCPFCLSMFTDGIKGAAAENIIQAFDIAEIIEKRIITE
jgi:Fe-S oxidoreductase